MNKELSKYLSEANQLIQNAEHHRELKEVVASILLNNNELEEENKQLKYNWNKLKEYCKTHYYGTTTIGILEVMKELEGVTINE